MPARSALHLNTDALGPSKRRVHPAAGACAVGLAVLLFCGASEAGRGLWQDEATLLANFGLPWTAYFRALPFYDQAGPPLALLLLDAIYLIADGAPQAMRLLLLALNGGIFVALALAAWRRGDRQVLLAIAVVAITPLAIRYAVELKQYIFELQASLLFLIVLRWMPRRPVLVFAAAGVLSFASFSVMLVVGVAALDRIVFQLRGPVRWRWLALLTAYTLVWLGCYLLIFRSATALQMANYPVAYERFALSAYFRHPGLLFAQVLAVARAQALIPAAGALVAAIGLLLPRPSGARAKPNGTDIWQPARVFVALLALVALLWLAGVYPVSSNKQFLFTLPIGALLIGDVVIAACDRFDRRSVTALLMIATILPSAAFAIALERRGAGTFQDTRGLYAFVRVNQDRLIVPTTLFEPTLRYYTAHDPQAPRRLAGLLQRESRPMEPAAQLLADLRTDDRPIPQHIWQPLDMTGAQAVYADWLIRRACSGAPAIVAAAQVGLEFPTMIVSAAKRHGCVVQPAYRATGVAAYRVDTAR